MDYGSCILTKQSFPVFKLGIMVDRLFGWCFVVRVCCLLIQKMIDNKPMFCRPVRKYFHARFTDGEFPKVALSAVSFFSKSTSYN